MICSLLTSYLSVRFTSERARTAWRILEYKGSSKMLRAIDSGSMTCSRTINAYQASLFLQQLSSWHSLTLCALYNFKILYIPQIVFVELRKVRQAFMLFKIQYEVLTFMACLLNHLTSESIRVVYAMLLIIFNVHFLCLAYCGTVSILLIWSLIMFNGWWETNRRFGCVWLWSVM